MGPQVESSLAEHKLGLCIAPHSSAGGLHVVHVWSRFTTGSPRVLGDGWFLG